MTRAPAVHAGDSLSTSELLHRIRACVKDVRHGARGADDRDHAVQQRLENLLRNAIAARSISEMAVALGSAAELRVFPAEADLERCTEAVKASGATVLRALIWTVRHRHARHLEQLRRRR
ncbi:hypothetical protein D3C81_1348350 [compost metagenome]|uniref:Uncharacterized protein n=1 Tax=Cupriavidus campinensis TaxID=151783 RepID=A0AAE9I5K5_9BURK|nr:MULTISPECIES: hypothetical protein [Cupriavidus]TSP13851.1 hypothetical protein FGG12_05050 [Cupriavidus campinensis]URF06502.1 hypothetical protein M5D45_25730 [Cupriavidus campinensis]CAG2134904.1 hypothetical protein LMG19282_00998 [Cupriavidus campinensis]